MKLLFILFFLTGCAGIAPVPGGSETVNKSYYTTKEDFIETLSQIKAGQEESLVFEILNHTKDDLKYLKREEIITALYGSTTAQINNDHQNSNQFLESLYGHRLFYKITERKHGFSSPIRIRTDESGFDYEVTLIFQNGYLYGQPILAGGIVNQSKSATIFDLLTPSKLLDQVMD